MGVEVDGVRAQVERLLHSKTFETSEVHRRLLQYLADKTISGEAGRLKEYIVGLEAFGKPPSYDPKHDSSVRLQVGRLRQKLMAYYDSEAADDSVLVTLPKGAFKLKFETVSGPSPATVPSRWLRPPVILGSALALVTIWALFSTVSLVSLKRQTAGIAGRWSPELETLWQPFLQSDRSLLICMGTPLFVRFPNFGFFRDPKSNDWQEIETSGRIRGVRKALGDIDIVPSYAFTGAGEAGAGFLVAQLLSPRKRNLLLTRSNILSWQQIADDNVVFLGPPKFNLQLQADALRQDIIIEPEGIRNLKPLPGEPEFLPDRVVPGKPSEGETHALISRTPGLSGAGEVLVIGGNASPDTLAAAEWMTQPRRAAELVNRLRSSSGEFPKYYQVVLHVTFKQGVPVQSSYVYHHVLKNKR